MAARRWVAYPKGRAAERLAEAVQALMAEGIASSESAAVILILVRGLDVFEAEHATRAASSPNTTDV